MKKCIGILMLLVSTLASAETNYLMKCARHTSQHPQYGEQLVLLLTVTTESSGIITLSYINASTHYAHYPIQVFPCPTGRECQQQQRQQHASQQVVATLRNDNFTSLMEMEDAILNEFCVGTWSTGLSIYQ